jgi:hypothetical protein
MEKVPVIRKINQDRGAIAHPYDNDWNKALFSVFDGHGQYGDQVAEFSMVQLLSKLKKHPGTHSFQFFVSFSLNDWRHQYICFVFFSVLSTTFITSTVQILRLTSIVHLKKYSWILIKIWTIPCRQRYEKLENNNGFRHSFH